MTSRVTALVFQELSSLPPHNLHVGLKQSCNGHVTDGCVYYEQVGKCPQHVKLVAHLHCYSFYTLYFSYFPQKHNTYKISLYLRNRASTDHLWDIVGRETKQSYLMLTCTDHIVHLFLQPSSYHIQQTVSTMGASTQIVMWSACYFWLDLKYVKLL